MAILGSDGHTVHNVERPGTGRRFEFRFTNGLESPNRIAFEQFLLAYTVTNANDVLDIDGRVQLLEPCVDCLLDFKHTNIVAVRMPTATVRASEMEVCWNSVTNRSYQVQYQSILNTNHWFDVGPPTVGTGTTNCVTDKVPLGEPKRFYRILATQ